VRAENRGLHQCEIFGSLVRFAHMASAAPDKLPKGRVLVHNHIKHTVDMPDGLNGCRCWTQANNNKEELIRCGCGWRGVEHYRVRALGGRQKLHLEGDNAGCI
jgi:hypothetical protein